MPLVFVLAVIAARYVIRHSMEQCEQDPVPATDTRALEKSLSMPLWRQLRYERGNNC